MKIQLLSMLFAGLVSAVSLSAAAVCPTTAGQTGTDTSGTGCSVLITFDASGNPTLSTTGLNPYDGAEDVTVGVVNQSKNAITSITLSSASGTDAFGFESDGIQTYASTNGVAIGTGGATGYEGVNNTFDTSHVSGGDGTLVVNFAPSVGPGGASYFSLEGTPGIAGGVSIIGTGTTPGGAAAPEPASIGLFGFGLGASAWLSLRRKRRS